VTTMSSASHARVSSRSERRTTNDNGSSRASGQPGGSRTERQDPRRPPSPQASASGTTHKRTTSSSQRVKGGVEERRTERVQVTTRETLTRTRSPERRPQPLQPQDRAKASEASRAYSADPRPRLSNQETPLGMPLPD
jgi:gamma-tubulin complex component 2